MNTFLAYAASYLLFRHPAYVQRCLLTYRLPVDCPSPLQRSYRRHGRRLSIILTGCEPDPEPPPAGPGVGASDSLPF